MKYASCKRLGMADFFILKKKVWGFVLCDNKSTKINPCFPTQSTFACSKSTLETLEKCVKYVQN